VIAVSRVKNFQSSPLPGFQAVPHRCRGKVKNSAFGKVESSS
jgi:hypothetical protein